MGAKLAELLKPVANGLSVIYVPAMWVLLVGHGLIGLLALISPDLAKGQINVLHGNGRIRVFGLYLGAIGILIFSQATLATEPLIPQVAAVALFLAGGTLVVLPALGLILVEWMLDRGPGFFRLIALLNILIAGLFYFAAQVPQTGTPEESSPAAEVTIPEGDTQKTPLERIKPSIPKPIREHKEPDNPSKPQ